jgi:hypothetical protein
MPILTIPDWGKGLNRDALPSELEPGFVSDCQNMRFRNGFAESANGLTQVFADFPSGNTLPRWITPFSYGGGTIFAGTTRYMVTACMNQVYADGPSARYVITRYLEPVAISTVTGATTTATVTTSTAHGLTTGDRIDTFGFVANPNVYNVTDVAVTVVNATRFAYTTSATTSGNSPTTIGSYCVVSSSTQTAFSVGVNYRWTGGNFNGVLILNNPFEGTYYWNGDNTKKMRRFAFTMGNAAVARPFKNYIVRIKQEKNGVVQPHNVSWTNSADPGAVPTTVTAAATNDAGEIELGAESPGELVDCRPLGDVNIIYKEDSYYAMQFIGGNDVFRFSRIGYDGLLAPNCVVEVPGVGHVYLSTNLDVRVHQGGPSRSIAEGRVRDWIRANVYSYNTAQTFAWVAVHKHKSEVIIALPISASTYTDKALVWNWESDSWGEIDLPAGCCAGAEGIFPAVSNLVGDAPRVVVGSQAASATIGRAHLLDYGTTLNGSTITRILERKGMPFGDSDRMKVISDSRWQIDGTAGSTFTISHGVSTTADGTVTYASGATMTLGTTNWTNAFTVQGRYAALKLSTTTTNAFKVRTVDADYKPGGRF